MIRIIINFIFLNFNNPLIIRITIIIQTILLNLIIGKIYYTFWFSYIIFLVFIGGLFILFIYIISIIYNNLLFFFKKNKLLYLLRIFILFFFLFNLKNFNFLLFNYESSLINSINLFKENYINSIKFFNFPNNLINLIIIIYLLLIIIIVVKITNFIKGTIKTIN